MNRKTARVVPALLFCALGTTISSAQQRTETNSSQPSATHTQTSQQTSEENADLSITAHVTARELRFEVVPNPRVEFPGKPERITLWEAERENLPEAVEPGVTYRNIGIRLKITSIFADIDRIVAEALGEVPLTDDATRPQPQTAPPAQPAGPEQQPAVKPPGTPTAQQQGKGTPR